MPSKKPKLSVNVTEELLDQIDAVVDQYGPFCKRHAVHLVALRIGLHELRRDPKRLYNPRGSSPEATL